MLLTAKILLTLSSLGYSLIPVAFDSNKTHWFNPSWTPHARFHCVWQVMSYVYMGILALFLIWTAGEDTRQLWIAAILSVCAYGGFWTAVLFRPVYEGHLVDKVNGVPPFMIKIFGKKRACDANVTLFTTAVLILFSATTFLALGSVAMANHGTSATQIEKVSK